MFGNSAFAAQDHVYLEYNLKGKINDATARLPFDRLQWTRNPLYYLPMHLQIPGPPDHILGTTYCVTGVIAAVILISIWKSSDSPNVSVGCGLVTLTFRLTIRH